MALALLQTCKWKSEHYLKSKIPIKIKFPILKRAYNTEKTEIENSQVHNQLLQVKIVFQVQIWQELLIYNQYINFWLL